MNVNTNGCPFCNEFNGRKDLSYFENTYGKKCGIQNRCVIETTNFACVPSVGSFVPGYVLVIPRKHFLSYLGMPDSYLFECQKIIKILETHFHNCYHSSYILYEHGAGDENNPGGTSVVHAHLHLLPCNTEIISQCPEYQFISFTSFFETVEYYRKNGHNKPYLLFRDCNATWSLSLSNNIPSQFFRKRVCDILGTPGMGDWKVFPFIENIQKTIANAQLYELQKIK